MKFRTFLFIAIGLIIISILGVTFYRNYEVLNQKFYIVEGLEAPVSVIILLAFIIGITITLLGGLSRELKVLFRKFRNWREEKLMESLEEKYFEGLGAISEGRYEKALTHFQVILERDPKNFNAFLKIGEVLCTTRRYKEAIEYHKKAHAIREEDTKPLYCLADDYEAMGDMERAKEQLNRIIGLKPRQAISAYRKLRQIHMKEGKWDEALDANTKVEKLTEDYARKDNKDERIGLGIRYQIALEELKKGEEKDAISTLRKIIKFNPNFIPAYIALGEAYKALDDERSAIESWNKGFEVTNSPIFLQVLEEHFLDKEEPFEAIEALKHCISHSKKDIIPKFFLGKLYFRLEMLDDALAALSSLRDRISYAPTLHYLIGRINEKRKNFQESVEEFKKVIKETELVKLEYICHACQEKHPDWYDRCPKCGEWSSIEVNFKEDISLEQLGLSSAPVYSSSD
ncbi:MAG: tetratricopeptide repeat protein [Acidobacteriota bacterium]